MPGDWLFGTTRSNELSKTNRFIIVWKLDLDSSMAPRMDNLQMLWLNAADLSDAAHVTGVRPKMDGNKMSMVIIKTKDKKLFFV